MAGHQHGHAHMPDAKTTMHEITDRPEPPELTIGQHSGDLLVNITKSVFRMRHQPCISPSPNQPQTGSTTRIIDQNSHPACGWEPEIEGWKWGDT